MTDFYPKSFLGRIHKRVHKASCFVLMPFDKRFDDVYKAVVQALQSPDLNLVCRRADDFRTPHILETILINIVQAEYILADTTGFNPNVFYELGIAHCVKEAEKVVIQAQSLDSVPFDLQHLRHIVYVQDSSGLPALQAELKATFRDVAKNVFRFRVWEGKRFGFGRKLVGRNNNLFKIEIESVYVGYDAVKLFVHFTEYSIDEETGPVESQFVILSEDKPSERVENIPWSLHLGQLTERDALLVLEKR